MAALHTLQKARNRTPAPIVLRSWLRDRVLCAFLGSKDSAAAAAAAVRGVAVAGVSVIELLRQNLPMVFQEVVVGCTLVGRMRKLL